MTEKSETKKKKMPTALKRKKQDLRKRMQNKSVKSDMHTASVKFSKMNSEEKSSFLPKLFSVLDKAAKKGVISSNKANRLKTRSQAKI